MARTRAMVSQDQVIGAVRTTFTSFEKANEVYMEQHFPQWQEKQQTFVIPPRYEYRDQYIPQEGSAITINSKLKENASDRLRGDQAEEKVVSAFIRYGRSHEQPMFIFHNFKFQMLQRTSKQLNLAEKGEQVTQEVDVIIVHRDLGVIVVEIKAIKNECDKEKDKQNYDIRNENNKKTYDKAVRQLDKAEKSLNKLYSDISCTNKTITKVIACPNLQEMPSTSSCGNIHLCKHNLIEFDDWWAAMIHTIKCDQVLCKNIYCNLVPKLLCGRSDICVLFSSRTIETRDRQETVKQLAERQGESITKKEWFYLTPEQCAAWNERNQIICGPFGSGKTILIQCKAVELARSGKEVMVIVPYHLVPQYEKFF